MRRVLAVLLGAALVVAGPVPAWAADEPLTVTSTGLIDGQPVGNRLVVHPTWTGAATAVETEISGRVTSLAPAVVQANGLRLRLLPADDDHDVDVIVRVRNAAGETAQATSRVHVDEKLPYPVTFSPKSGTIVHGNTTVTVTDVPDDVATVVVNDLFSTTVIARLSSAPWTFTFDAAKYGGHLLITVTDRAANFADYDVVYHADYAGPRITAETPFDDFPQVVTENTQYIYAGTKDQSAVRRLEFRADGQVVPVTAYPFVFDFGKKSRTVNAEFRAWDVWGNESVLPFPVKVDASAPVVTKMTPAGNILVHGSRVTSAITAVDGTHIWWATLQGTGTDFTAPYTGSIPAGKDGRLMLRWHVSDDFGHTAQFTRFVTVDNTKPGLRIVSAPKNGAKVKGAVRVVAAASDRNGINRVELIINGKIVSAGTGTFSINTAKYGKTLKVQFRAWDRAGNWQVTPVRTWRR